MQGGDNGFVLRQNVNEVNLIFTVTDRHGRFINNLQQSDFALLDDQRAPAQVYSFSQQNESSPSRWACDRRQHLHSLPLPL